MAVEQIDTQRGRRRVSNFVLDGEYIGQSAVKRFAPKRCAVGGTNQSNTDSRTIARFSDASFQIRIRADGRSSFASAYVGRRCTGRPNSNARKKGIRPPFVPEPCRSSSGRAHRWRAIVKDRG
jgi:hypothetical protein